LDLWGSLGGSVRFINRHFIFFQSRSPSVCLTQTDRPIPTNFTSHGAFYWIFVHLGLFQYQILFMSKNEITSKTRIIVPDWEFSSVINTLEQILRATGQMSPSDHIYKNSVEQIKLWHKWWSRHGNRLTKSMVQYSL
jgi:hypothetical protein